MAPEISEEIKKKIFKLISTPGIEIHHIVDEVNLDHNTVMEILTNEYVRSDLNQGRRLCCRF